MRVKFIIAAILIILAIAGGIFLLVSGRKTPPPHNIANFEEFIQVPSARDIMNEMQAESGAKLPEGQTQEERASREMAARTGMDTMASVVSQPQLPETGPASGQTLQAPVETSEPAPPSPQPQAQTEAAPDQIMPQVGDISVDVENISVPDIQPELGGGISVSGTIALEEAYYQQHDLQKAQKLALDILKQNPNDPTAKKILKLIEYESKGNQALMRGDYSTALQYFQKMQEIDPNNKWAKKGIIRAQSGG